MFRRVLPWMALLLVTACPRQSQVRPTPAPSFSGRPIDSVSTADVNAYAATLQFDSTKPASDTLTVQTPTGDTVHLEVEPEIGTVALSAQDLAAGRILARIRSSAAFPPLGVASGANYFWVSGEGERAHAVMIPADSLARRVRRPLVLHHHPMKLQISTARFLTVGAEGNVIFLINTRCSDNCCGFMSDHRDEDTPKVDSALMEMHKSIDAGS
jgi:hypothetical protein